jgi:hypothetical protein
MTQNFNSDGLGAMLFDFPPFVTDGRGKSIESRNLQSTSVQSDSYMRLLRSAQAYVESPLAPLDWDIPEQV